MVSASARELINLKQTVQKEKKPKKQQKKYSTYAHTLLTGIFRDLRCLYYCSSHSTIGNTSDSLAWQRCHACHGHADFKRQEQVVEQMIRPPRGAPISTSPGQDGITRNPQKKCGKFTVMLNSRPLKKNLCASTPKRASSRDIFILLLFFWLLLPFSRNLIQNEKPLFWFYWMPVSMLCFLYIYLLWHWTLLYFAFAII